MSYPQCGTYTGAVNTNRNVLRFTFSAATSTAPILTAYDDDNFDSVISEILAGTTVTSNSSFLKAVETTSGAPGGAWCTVSTNDASNPSGGPNALKGSDRYVPCSAVAGAGGTKLFNIVSYCPSDVSAGASGHSFAIVMKYTYTTTAPTLTWEINTGTEGTPVWTTFDSTHTLYFTGSGTTITSIEPVVYPFTGSKVCEEMWFG